MKKVKVKVSNQSYYIELDEGLPKNSTVIYKVENEKIKTICVGANLKEACKDWIELLEDPSLLFESFEIWLGEELDPNISLFEPAKLFDKYIETLDSDELFSMLAPSEFYTYIDWTAVHE